MQVGNVESNPESKPSKSSKPSNTKTFDWKAARREIIDRLDIAAEYSSWGARLASTTPNPEGWIKCHAFRRDDTTPSARICVGDVPHRGNYKDFGGEGESLTFFYAAAKYGPHKTHQDAERYYAEKVGVTLPSSGCGDKSRLDADLDFSPGTEIHPAAAYSFCKKYKRTTIEQVRNHAAAMQRIGVRKARLEKHKEGGQPQIVWVTPFYGSAFTKADPIGYVLMGASGLPLRICVNKKFEDRDKHNIGTSGLMNAFALNHIDKAEVVLWVEGITDCFRAEEEIPAELRGKHVVISSMSGAGEHIKPEWVQLLTGKHVLVCCDCDDAGRNGAAKRVAALSGKAASVKDVVLPYPIEKKKGKDLRDFFDDGKTYADLLALADAVEPVVDEAEAPEESPDETIDKLCAIENKTEFGNANRLVRRFGDQMLYCHPWSKWLVWDGRRWRLDDTGAATTFAKRMVRSMLREASYLDNDDDRKALAEWSMFCEQSKYVSAALRLAQNELPVLVEKLDKHPWLLNCTNGTLDLRTGVLGPHEQGHYLTKLCGTAYIPEATCPVWEATLEKIFSGTSGSVDLIVFIQRLFGYCLTGNVQEQILPIFHGEGSNGKSLILKVMSAVLGKDYAMTAPKGFLDAKRDAHPTEVADLFGMRFVIAVETSDDQKLDEELVKSLTGGDAKRARRMREDFWEFDPTHKIILCTNHKPEIKGTDHAIWRRPRLVPFQTQFWDPNDPKNDPEHLDPELRQDKLLDEKLLRELPGILAWCVRGCLEWQKYGLELPECVAAATDEYRTEQDVLGAFIAECCIVNQNAQCKATPLYEAYKAWAERAGEYAVTQRRFGTAMTKRKGIGKKTNNGTWYVGIGLRASEGVVESWSN